MPTPDTNGVPPFADFDDLKRKINEIVQKYNNLLVNLDSLNVVSLTADHIDAGTILANLVTIMGSDGGRFFKIDGDGIVANNGSVDTMKFDLATGLLTIVSALIQSATGYPKVVLNSADTLVGAYADANNYTLLKPDAFGSTPGLTFISSLGAAFMYLLGSTLQIGTPVGNSDIQISSGKNLDLFCRVTSGYHTRVDSWSALQNFDSGHTLQQDLNTINVNINSLFAYCNSLDARVTALGG